MSVARDVHIIYLVHPFASTPDPTPLPAPYLLRTPSECDIIVSRIHKCHHQSLSHVNRTKLEVLWET